MLLDTKPITRDQEKYYQALFSGCKDYVEIRLIDQQGRVKPVFFTVNELANYQTPQDRNVFAGIFQRRRKGNGTIENCTSTNVIYLDFDDMELPEINYRIDQAGIPQPGMIVNSGHGYHVYWLLDKPAGHEIKPLLDKLVEILQADPKSRDIARVLRVPDTMNVKGEPVPCRLIELNSNRATVQQFEKVLGVKAQAEQITLTGAVRELAEVKFNGLHNMAAGVEKGERNFATGRIVQTLKRLNYTKQETAEIIYRWNDLNRPKKNVRELKKDINTFWHDDRYKYDGKEFTKSEYQELNERFIDSSTTFFKADDTDTHNYDNELLKPEYFRYEKKENGKKPKVTGLTFAILSIIKLAESEGIRKEHIADLCKRDKTDKNIRISLKLLQDMKYIKAIKKGRTYFYTFTEKANYKRGFTAVSKSLHRSFIHGELKEHEYKMMILLESYAFDDKKEIYPSNPTLAYRLGRTDRNVRDILKQLQHKQFIKVEFKKGKRYIRLIYR